MADIDLKSVFAQFDELEPKLGYLHVIDAAMEAVDYVHDFASKMAEGPSETPKGNKYVKLLGALAQMWKDPSLKIPQHPSSLGQVLVMGGAGALAGYGAGKLVDRVLPNDVIKAKRVGAILGGMAGTVPGLFSAYANTHIGQPAWSSSFYDTTPGKVAGFYGLDPSAVASINVQDFHNAMWNDPRLSPYLPLQVRAAASGLVQGASNLPDKRRNSHFVTPFDVARVAVGMGSGLSSGWLVGKTLGALFGTGKSTQKLIRNAGMAIGALKTVIPVAYGAEPYEY